MIRRLVLWAPGILLPFEGDFGSWRRSSVTEDRWVKCSTLENLCLRCIWSGLFYQAPSPCLILQCLVQVTVEVPLAVSS